MGPEIYFSKTLGLAGETDEINVFPGFIALDRRALKQEKTLDLSC